MDGSPRRQFLHLVAAGTVGGLAGCTESTEGVSGPTSAGSEGSAFRSDPGRTGVTRAAGPTAPVTERWTVETADPVEGEDVSTPVVADGTVYVVAESDGRLHALRAADGSERWAAGSNLSTASPPAIAGDTVYVGGDGARDGGGRMYALAESDGSERWATGTPGNGYAAAPAVVDGVVYAGLARGLAALDAGNGERFWHNARAGTLGTAAVGGESAYGVTTYGLVAFDPDGTSRFLSESVGASGTPAVRDGTVYVGGDGSGPGAMYALDAGDGTERWRLDTGAARGESGSTPAVTGGTVYASLNPGDDTAGGGYLYALDASDGTERWSVRVPEWSTAPTVADETVHVGTPGGVRAYATADGHERWRFGTAGDLTRPPVVADGVVYAVDDAGRVYAIEGD
jgi:outer membrane protein assembly factor BamB